MAEVLKAGARLRSVTCETEVVVVRAPTGEVDLRCGGAAMAPMSGGQAREGGPVTPFDEGTVVGKRYVSDEEGLEVLCTKPGAGSLSIGDAVLTVKGAKPLPSSD